MNRKNLFKFDAYTILTPILLVLISWVVYWMEIRFSFSLTHMGVEPRALKGIRGVIFSPFIHSNLGHLWNNTLPVLILSTALFYFYRDGALRTLFLGMILTGVLTWIIGRPSVHIGASGLIYFLSSFLFFRGIRSKHYRLIALSLIVIFIYGSLVWGTLPGAVEDNVSWEGHLSGFMAGLLLAYILKIKLPEKEVYLWEKKNYIEDDDPFMRQFDEHGNFIELKEEE